MKRKTKYEVDYAPLCRLENRGAVSVPGFTDFLLQNPGPKKRVKIGSKSSSAPDTRKRPPPAAAGKK